MIEPTEFEKDDARRIQKDSEATLRKSIGVQDTHGEQLHGHERTLAAREMRSDMKAALDGHPAKEPDPKRDGEPITSIVINAPNKVDFRGGAAAITIAPAQANAGAADATVPVTPWQPIPGSAANAVTIEPFASLLKTTMDANQTVAHLTDDFTPGNGDLLYLKFTYDAITQLITGADLICDSGWGTYPDVMKSTGTGTLTDPYIVAESYFIVAYAKLASDTTTPSGDVTIIKATVLIKVIRTVFTPLALETINLSGLSFDFPFPPARLI